MKDMLALLIFLSFSISSIYLAVTKKIDLKMTITLLCFSIISGLSAANYDIIKKYKWGGIEIETAIREISEAKESALKDISTEVKDQKESIKLLISNANDTRDKIEKQKEALSDLIRKASDLQAKIEDQKKKILPMVIPNAKERSDWVKNLQNILPSRE